jgi:hypothetical protein
MNCGTGAMGPFNRANATIGRAYGLLSMNLQGGSEPGMTYLGSQGNAYMYSSIPFAENEERSPWKPFHVQKGFGPEESVVSIWSGIRSTAYCLGLRETYWRTHVRNMLRGLHPHLNPTLVLDPITAQQFVDRGGFDTAEALIDWVHENATMPAAVYWDYQLIQNYVLPRALNGEEPWASMLAAPADERIRVYPKNRIHVVVVGGETNGYWRIMGGNFSKSVSIDAWR